MSDANRRTLRTILQATIAALIATTALLAGLRDVFDWAGTGIILTGALTVAVTKLQNELEDRGLIRPILRGDSK